MTQSYDVIPARPDQPVSDAAALFVSNELLPMMIGFWPKSANQINGNLTGNAIAYGMMLKGISPKQIRNAVVALADREPSREYAPEPQLLKRLCMETMQPQTQMTGFIASITALEMQVYVMCVNGQIPRTKIDAEAALTDLIDGVYAKGGTVDGRPGWQPLKTIVQPRYLEA